MTWGLFIQWGERKCGRQCGSSCRVERDCDLFDVLTLLWIAGGNLPGTTLLQALDLVLYLAGQLPPILACMHTLVLTDPFPEKMLETLILCGTHFSFLNRI
jgi:hypothetical protein